MAQRAGENVVTAKRCSASAVLRAYMGDLVDAIQDAEIPAITMKLYSSNVISKDTKDRVRLPGLIATEKTSCLLDALEGAVKIRPQVLDTFLTRVLQNTYPVRTKHWLYCSDIVAYARVRNEKK